MPSSRYALVAYIHHPVGQFVENLRQELHPVTTHMAAHLTILPPRQLSGSEEAALEFLEEACSRVVPFDVEMGEVGTFLPTTPTVFIQVKRAAYRMRELHDQLSVKALHCDEPWPYIPHWERGKLAVGAQFFNLFNHPNFDQPVGDFANPQFGSIVSTVNTPTSILGSFLGGDASPRLIQLKATLTF